MNEPGYEKLAAVLARAYDQAAIGKGKERHANGKAFHLQPMQDLCRSHPCSMAWMEQMHPRWKNILLR